MTERQTWEAIRAARMGTAEAQAGYERARLASVFGELIRTLRESQGLTQAGLAVRIATSQSAVARLEAGGAEPKLDMVKRLATAFGVELAISSDGVRVVTPAA